MKTCFSNISWGLICMQNSLANKVTIFKQLNFMLVKCTSYFAKKKKDWDKVTTR